jgi:transposase
MLSRVELFAQIRRARRLDPRVSTRALAARYRVSRRTVGAALADALPPPRKALPPRASVLDPAMGWIDEMLRADLTAPRKQRHTIRRIFERLATEYGFTAARYTTIRTYVNRRRPQIAAQARGDRYVVPEGMVPQEHEPGAEAEVDFCEAWVRLAGVPTECQLFSFRLSYSGKTVHRVFATGSQEAFMEGHVEAFRVLGGVPWRHVRYDNLKSAVNEVCFGRTRLESRRWTAFRSHYGFDAFYCLPGKEGAHEKGGVETRAAGSAVITSCQCPKWTAWTSSTSS